MHNTIKGVMLSCSDPRRKTSWPLTRAGSDRLIPKGFELNAKAIPTQKKLELRGKCGRGLWFTSLQRLFCHLPAIPLPEQEPLHNRYCCMRECGQSRSPSYFQLQYLHQGLVSSDGAVNCLTPGSCVPSYAHNYRPMVSMGEERCTPSKAEGSPCLHSSEYGNKDFEASHNGH